MSVQSSETEKRSIHSEIEIRNESNNFKREVTPTVWRRSNTGCVLFDNPEVLSDKLELVSDIRGRAGAKRREGRAIREERRRVSV
jgi:hypothetical protein